MKKLILIIAIIANVISAFAQDSLYIVKNGTTISSYAISDVDSIIFTNPYPYIEINGVKWATRNVASPGFFAVNPEDYGGFYQWNSKISWSSANPLTSSGGSTWNSSWMGGYTTPSISDTWNKANDPSPIGYRIPTNSEILKLLDATKVTRYLTTQKGVTGEIFIDKITGNSIFFPAAGWRDSFSTLTTGIYGELYGLYWINISSSTSSSNGFFLRFNYTGCSTGENMPRATALPIRPVIK